MKVKRTWTDRSLRAGQTQIDDEETVRNVFRNTDVSYHPEGACGTALCSSCEKPAMQQLLGGGLVKTFFCDFELIEA